jgi:hypothetical protein
MLFALHQTLITILKSPYSELREIKIYYECESRTSCICKEPVICGAPRYQSNDPLALIVQSPSLENRMSISVSF